MSSIIYRGLWLSYGVSNPVYCSYKTIKDKNVKEYVHLMMYWVVFAIYSSFEVFADVFLSWLPFYLETKIIFLLWISLPISRGSTLLYTRCIHPRLVMREHDIDLRLGRMKDHCIKSFMFLASKGVGMFSNLLLTATEKGKMRLVNHLRSLSLSDLTIEDTSFEGSDTSEAVLGGTLPHRHWRRCILRSNTITSPMDHSKPESSDGRDLQDRARTTPIALESSDVAQTSLELISGPISLTGEHCGDNNDCAAIKEPLNEISDSTPFKELSLVLVEKREETNSIDLRKVQTPITVQTPNDHPTVSRSETNSPSTPHQSTQAPDKFLETMRTSGVLNVTSPAKKRPSDHKTGPGSSQVQVEAAPSSSLKTFSRPPAKSSGFTKINFLRSLTFFDKKVSKATKASCSASKLSEKIKS